MFFIIVYCPGISVSNLKNSLLLISLITSKYSSNRSCLEFCGKIEDDNLKNKKKGFSAWFKIRTLDLPIKNLMVFKRATDVGVQLFQKCHRKLEPSLNKSLKS